MILFSQTLGGCFGSDKECVLNCEKSLLNKDNNVNNRNYGANVVNQNNMMNRLNIIHKSFYNTQQIQ